MISVLENLDLDMSSGADPFSQLTRPLTPRAHALKASDDSRLASGEMHRTLQSRSRSCDLHKTPTVHTLNLTPPSLIPRTLERLYCCFSSSNGASEDCAKAWIKSSAGASYYPQRPPRILLASAVQPNKCVETILTYV